MQQYFTNRELNEIIPNEEGKPILNEKYDNKTFANQRFDKKWNIEFKIFQNCTFSKMGFLQSQFKNIELRYSIFIDCYFRNAKFEAVDFTGVLFINCNFDSATFVNCIFEYAKFTNCMIEYDILKENLPRARHNLNRDLCRNLCIECLRLGSDKDYRKYYFEEKRASEKYYWKKFYHRSSENDNYYNKYNLWEQIGGFFSFLLSKCNNIIWGYGEKLSRLLMNMLIIVLTFSVIYGFLYNQDITNLATQESNGWFGYIYLSLCNFFTFSPSNELVKDTIQYKYLAIIEAGLGVVSMGFFVAALFRYVNRRG